jgi:hypothetical protein
MSRFTDVRTDLEELFATTDWTATGIQAFPANFAGGTAQHDEFVIVEVVPGKLTTRRNRSFQNVHTVSGQYIVQIYVRTGTAMVRSLEIADILDNLLNSKRLTSGTQTGIPVVDVIGTDTDDKTLYRVDLIVNFIKY